VEDRVSGIHLIEGDVSETALDANLSGPGRYLDRLTGGVRRAVASGAQAVIVAEGVLGMMAAENGLHEVEGVPVIDTIGTPILFAEFMVVLKHAPVLYKAGWPILYPMMRPGNSSPQRAR
jgi:allantoin racemase